MQEIANYVGYLASVFIVGSFMFKSLTIIRFVNLLGCLCFVFFGFFSAEEPLFPVIIPNGLLASLQVYYLVLGAVSKK